MIPFSIQPDQVLAHVVQLAESLHQPMDPDTGHDEVRAGAPPDDDGTIINEQNLQTCVCFSLISGPMHTASKHDTY